MKYFIIALINSVYGILLLATLSRETAGFYLVIFIGLVLTILGFIGLGLWFWKTICSGKSCDQSTVLKNWFQVAKSIDVLLVIGLLFRSFVLQPFLVEGNSMEPNYHNKEFLLVDRITYEFRKPNRGEVIIFRFPKNPSEDYIKRIIGLPGDNIKIENSQVFINNVLSSENYLSPGTQTDIDASTSNSLNTTLKQGEYFVLGDNRNASSDSREWGTVPEKNIIGRTWFVVFPIKNFGKINNPQISFNNDFILSSLVNTKSFIN
ncbi:MAG: signal peptidase I [Patescibacteria group bacterium]|jgi:signal peptidase I